MQSKQIVNCAVWLRLAWKSNQSDQIFLCELIWPDHELKLYTCITYRQNHFLDVHVVQATVEALCCILEQDTLSSA